MIIRAILVAAALALPSVSMASVEDTGLVGTKIARKAAARSVLEGVPRVGYDVRLSPFPGCVCACMEFIKDPCDYDYVMAVSGAAFRRLWNRDDGGNVDLMYFAPEPYIKTFKALGYSYRVTPRPRTWSNDDGGIRSEIVDSITRGMPVLAFGVIGPPECGIITGYDKMGEVIYGYSYFQDPSVKGYYEKADWIKDMDPYSLGIITIEKKSRKPSETDTLIATLKWAIDLELTKERREAMNHTCGLAAYDGWAAGLEVDADYPKDDAEVLYTRLMVHGDQCTMLGDRASAARYLKSAARLAPEAATELLAAADLYKATSAMCDELWPWKSCNYKDPEVQQALADPEVRRKLAKAARKAGQTEMQAVYHLQAALAAIEKTGR